MYSVFPSRCKGGDFSNFLFAIHADVRIQEKQKEKLSWEYLYTFIYIQGTFQKCHVSPVYCLNVALLKAWKKQSIFRFLMKIK